MTQSNYLPAVYLIAGPAPWNITITDTVSLAGHCYHEKNKYRIIWPEELSAKIVSPGNISQLRDTLLINEIILVDRLQGIDYPACVAGHINRSGTNYLIGRTPYRDLPRFPDMGGIYLPINDLKAINVHTVGSRRFGCLQSRNEYILSEGIALVAMVMHYSGLKIRAVGADPVRINLLSRLPDFIYPHQASNSKCNIKDSEH
ncbi:MAG: hypothetical protein ABIA75_14630 [Candidatus Neomarinimicrobiota bacterium]